MLFLLALAPSTNAIHNKTKDCFTQFMYNFQLIYKMKSYILCLYSNAKYCLFFGPPDILSKNKKMIWPDTWWDFSISKGQKDRISRHIGKSIPWLNTVKFGNEIYILVINIQFSESDKVYRSHCVSTYFLLNQK